MFAEIAVRAHRSTKRADRAAHRPPRLLGFAELDAVIARVAADYLDGATVMLLSTTRADDGAYVVLDCDAGGAHAPLALARAADAVATALDPAQLGAVPGAAVRVRFFDDAPAR